jgi:cellulose synthase/poly-beta-1,6-N-acetylglucosamine synthase-like glycosyltransferase
MMPTLPDWTVVAAIIVQWTVLAIGLLLAVFYLLQFVLAAIAQYRRPPVIASAVLWGRYADLAPPIAVIVPARNEDVTVVDTVTSLLALYYPDVEVIVVNDGSTDATLARLVETFGLGPVQRSYEAPLAHEPIRGLYGSPAYPRLLVVDKTNGGKADALNTGINLARAPLFCAVDADSLLESDALLRGVLPFIEDPTGTIAVGGTVRVANGSEIKAGSVTRVRLPRRFLALVQTLEYLRSFLAARLSLGQMNALTVISGAFGLFSREAALAVGGYSRDTVAEDMEIVVKLHRHMREAKRDYRIAFVPEPVCWTEVPADWRTLGIQRARWQRGAMETLAKHRRMLLNPRYGSAGTIGFGQILVVDLLTPLFEVLGYIVMPIMWLLGLLSTAYMLAFLGVTFAMGVFMGIAAMTLEEAGLRRFPKIGDLLILLLVAIIENFGYRQINNLWRLRGIAQFLAGDRSWGRMRRRGFVAEG